jgi:polysaccharide biosynthesis transport protein
VAMEVVDPAYLHPDVEPVWPKDTMNYFLGVLLGLVTGLAMAFLVEYFNDGLRTRTEAERELDLPVLATIPESPLRNRP